MSNLHEKKGPVTALADSICDCMEGSDSATCSAALSDVVARLFLIFGDFDKERAHDGVDLLAVMAKELIDSFPEDHGTVQ